MNELNIERLILSIEDEKDKAKKQFAKNIIESVAKCFDDMVQISGEDGETNLIKADQSIEELIICKIVNRIEI